MSGIGNKIANAHLCRVELGFTSGKSSAEHGFTSRWRSTEHGFTLIEALVVMAVAALIAGVMFPRVEQSLDLWHFRSSLTAVQSALEDARAHALRTGSPARFSIASTGARFSASGREPTMLAPSVRFGKSDDSVVFFSDGSSTGGHVVLNGAAGRQATLAISPDTGLIGLMQ